jgi:hypothetical protein
MSLEERRAEASRGSWQAVRTILNARRDRLARRAVELYGGTRSVRGLLVPEGWLASRPVPLEDVGFGWVDVVEPPLVVGSEPETELLRPMRTVTERYERYSQALGAIAGPGVFEDRPCYRLVDLAIDGDRARLAFGRTSYFDVLDVCEAVAHEYARETKGCTALPAVRPLALDFRTLIGDPADLGRRAVVPAISVLTLRRPKTGPSTFVLHRRDWNKAMHTGGTLQVMPVGVFQPSGPGPVHERNDFGLLRNIARQYSEEFLGEPVCGGIESIDYDVWPFYSALRDAQRDGRLRLHWLGVGIDPLSLAVDMLVVAVFDADLYDQLFERMVTVNAEGIVVGQRGPRRRGDSGFPFVGDVLADLVERRPLQTAGAALLNLAWQHRHMLMA